jgi:hypothetical protein
MYCRMNDKQLKEFKRKNMQSRLEYMLLIMSLDVKIKLYKHMCEMLTNIGIDVNLNIERVIGHLSSIDNFQKDHTTNTMVAVLNEKISCMINSPCFSYTVDLISYDTKKADMPCLRVEYVDKWHKYVYDINELASDFEFTSNDSTLVDLYKIEPTLESGLTIEEARKIINNKANELMRKDFQTRLINEAIKEHIKHHDITLSESEDIISDHEQGLFFVYNPVNISIGSQKFIKIIRDRKIVLRSDCHGPRRMREAEHEANGKVML